MKTKKLQYGLTLTELLTVIAIIVVLAVVSMPAMNAIFSSMGSSGSAEAMINAALSNARATAMSRQRYVGVRFQKIYDSRGPLYADQYMIFVINEPGLENSSGYPVQNAYRALEGTKPIKLPSETAVLDVSDDMYEEDIDNLTDRSTFTIIFAPSGNLKIEQTVQVLRFSDADPIFNNTSATDCMFQDDFGNDPLFVSETSRRSFYIYDRNKFKNAYKSGTPFTDYLFNLSPVYINPYTGKIISTD